MSGVALLLAVVVVALAWSARREPGGIVLPEGPADSSGVNSGSGPESVSVVEITPETVQIAIATLSRPASYSRSQTVETFWSGGSGQSVSQVYVSGGRTRLDTQLPDGSIRHMLLAGELAGVWYDDEEDWTVLRGGELTADQAGRMPTYETVLALPAEEIAQADCRQIDGVSCIYVETAADDSGCADRYWVSVENGLLYAAERTQDGQVIYRFTASLPESGGPAESLFLLPDGSALESAGT